MPRMVIELEQDNITIITEKDGRKTIKPASLQDLQAILTKDRNLETPILPGSWGTIKFVNTGDRELYVMTIPPHIRNVSFDYRSEAPSPSQRYKKFKVPVPGSIWFITVRVSKQGSQETRQLLHTMTYALKNSVMSERDVLYKFPFSNVGSDYVCWGGNDPHPTHSKSLQSIPDQFFANHFNSDLDGKFAEFHWDKKGARVKAFRTMHLFEYLDELQTVAETTGKNAEFRYDILQSTGHSVEDKIRSHMGRMNR